MILMKWKDALVTAHSSQSHDAPERYPRVIVRIMPRKHHGGSKTTTSASPNAFEKADCDLRRYA